MATPRGAYLKVIRAEEHLAAVKAEIATFKELKPYVPVGQVESDPPGYLVRLYEAHTLPVRPRLSAGDCIHNLRSALDHLAWQLVKAAGNEPRTDRPRTQFPIFNDPLPDGKPVTIHGGISVQAAAILNSLQPYVRGDAARSHPLSVINNLDNIDKHQRLNFTISTAASTACFVQEADSDAMLGGQMQSGPFFSGDPIAWFPGFVPTNEVEVYVQFSTLVSMPEATGGDTSVEAVNVLSDLCQFVRESVIDRFARTCF